MVAATIEGFTPLPTLSTDQALENLDQQPLMLPRLVSKYGGESAMHLQQAIGSSSTSRSAEHSSSLAAQQYSSSAISSSRASEQKYSSK
jgi:hypothetical protein